MMMMMMMRQMRQWNKNNFAKIAPPPRSFSTQPTNKNNKRRNRNRKPLTPATARPRKNFKDVKPNLKSVSDSPFESLRKHAVAVISEGIIRFVSRANPNWENRIKKCVGFTYNSKARLMRRLLFDRECGFSYEKHFWREKEEIVSLSKVIGCSMAALLFYMGGIVIVQQFPAFANPEVKAARGAFDVALELQSKKDKRKLSSVQTELKALKEKNEEKFRSMEIQKEESDERLKKMEEELKSLKTWTSNSWFKRWFF